MLWKCLNYKNESRNIMCPVTIILQVASESESVPDEVEQSEIPIIVKHVGVSDSVVKVANSSLDEEPSVDKVEIINKLPITKDEEIVTVEDGDGAYLTLNGDEEECVFTSTAPETKPTISVS